MGIFTYALPCTSNCQFVRRCTEAVVPSGPRWHDRLSIFNPTTIVFRYAAIVDRRIRPYKWNRVDFAAINTLFWTERGWNGFEEMVTLIIPYCPLLPDSTVVGLVSMEILKTIVTAAPGVQAAVTFVGGLTGTVDYNPL
jgi:hypothetical protein